jgi:nitroreductase
LQEAEAWPVPYWDVDTGMAVMLILLAAVEEGLGAWLFGIPHGEAVLLRELGVPEGCRPIGVVALGHPLPGQAREGSSVTRRRRPLESMVHFGRWSAE